MNVYDKVNELARILKTTPEVMDYKKASEKVNLNEANKRIIEDFRNKQMELYTIQMQGVEPSKEQMEGVNSLWSIINLNTELKEYFEVEMKFSRLWEDIMKILGEAVHIDMNI